MKTILTYQGKKPDIDRAGDLAPEVLKLMLKQLEVLQEMVRTVVFIPEGTRVTMTDLNPPTADP